jgi:hypothetical protein
MRQGCGGGERVICALSPLRRLCGNVEAELVQACPASEIIAGIRCGTTPMQLLLWDRADGFLLQRFSCILEAPAPSR